MAKKSFFLSLILLPFLARSMEKGEIVINFGSIQTAKAFQYKGNIVFARSATYEISNPAIVALVSEVERVAYLRIIGKNRTWVNESELRKLLFEDCGVSKITITITALTLAQEKLNMPKSSINCNVEIEQGSGKKKKIECIKGLEMCTNKLVD